MAKNISKKEITPVDNLELIVSTLTQEVTSLHGINTALSLKNTDLLAKIENLEARNKLLINERVTLRAGFYTISMKVNDFHWCVPSLKKSLKEIIKDSIN